MLQQLEGHPNDLFTETLQLHSKNIDVKGRMEGKQNFFMPQGSEKFLNTVRSFGNRKVNMKNVINPSLPAILANISYLMYH